MRLMLKPLGASSMKKASLTLPRAYGPAQSGREGQVDRILRICAALPSAFEKMSHGTPRFFDSLLRDRDFALQVAHTRGENLAQRRLGREPTEHFGRNAVLAILLHDLIQQGTRHDGILAQGPHALPDDGEGDDRADEQRPDRPSCCLNDGKHGLLQKVGLTLTAPPRIIKQSSCGTSRKEAKCEFAQHFCVFHICCG